MVYNSTLEATTIVTVCYQAVHHFSHNKQKTTEMFQSCNSIIHRDCSLTRMTSDQ